MKIVNSAYDSMKHRVTLIIKATKTSVFVINFVS